MSFSDIEEDLLINLVAKHPTIYDISNADYRDVSKKETLWELIGQELNKNSEDCKKRWKLIRDGYQRFKRKCSMTGSGVPRNSKHNRHEQLSFLESIPHRRAGSSNIPESHQSQSNSPQETDDTDNSSDEEEDEGATGEESPDQRDRNNDKDDQRLKTKGKRKNSNNIDHRELKYRKERDMKMHKLLKMVTKKKEDDVELFCRHIAEVLRSLPPVYKAEAKKHISVIVSNFEIKAAQLTENPLLLDVKTQPRRNSSSMSQYS